MVYPICRIAVFALLGVQLVLQVNIVSAQNLVTFDPNAAGIDKSVGSWGVDAAWPSYDNVRISINNLGLQNVDFVRVNFYTDEALTSTGELGPEARSRLDAQLALADLAGDVPIGILPNSGSGTDGYYFNNGTDNSQGLRVDRWVNVIRATRDYIANQTGRSLKFVEPFNEPDYLANQGSREQLGEITSALAADSSFNGTELMAASTLRANNNAYFWYDGARGPATAGSTHLLDSEADGDFRVLEAYANFLGNYIDPNDDAWNPEIHSMAEILVGAEVGMDGGSVWGAAMRNRGLAMQASDGKRLGYAADYENESAAAVYRAPNGQILCFCRWR